MDKTMKLWHALALNILTGVITGLTLLSFTRAGQKIDKNDEVIKSKADIVYVDKCDADLKKDIDKKVDKDTFEELRKSIDDMKGDVRDIRNYILNAKR